MSGVTGQRLVVSPRTRRKGGHLFAAVPAPVPLRSSLGGSTGLFLDITLAFEIVETDRAQSRPRLRVATRMYQYRLLDYHHRELLVYHWQPGAGFRGPDHPHMHISAALNAQVDAVTRREIGLDKLHVETGPVSLEAFIGMLITEFGVAPRRHDWRETLDRTGPDLNAALDTR